MISIVLLTILIVAAVFWFAYSYNKKKNAVIASWSETTGVILGTNIMRENDDRQGASYIPYVTYSYLALGQTLTGKRVAYKNMNYSTQKRAQAVIDTYPVGKSVIVYFDPQKPSDAVLERLP
eukprot:gene19368-19780_t